MKTYLVAVLGYDYDSDERVTLSFFVEAGSHEKAKDIVGSYNRVRTLERVTFMEAKQL